MVCYDCTVGNDVCYVFRKVQNVYDCGLLYDPYVDPTDSYDLLVYFLNW